MKHPPLRNFSHAQVVCNNLFDCVRACGQSLRQDASREKAFIMEKLRSNLRKVSQRSCLPVFVIKGKLAHFEALAAVLDCRQTDGGFSESSTKFSIYRLGSLPLQREEFHYVSLLMFVHFGCVHVFLTFQSDSA
jgi:hypothetical protein